MACRKINPVASLSCIIKTIDYAGEPLPTYDKLKYNHDRLTDWFDSHKIDIYTKEAIIQQYNEIFIYEILDLQTRQLVAPQIEVNFDPLTNVPSITYVSCPALITQEEVYKYSENELYALLGSRAHQLEIPEQQLFTFLKETRDFCANYALNVDDILNNPSNIGFNQYLGLRIIDFGLMENFNIY